MPKINPRTKGSCGEREFCEWLFDNFGLAEKPERNLDQVRAGGADVICQPFAFEVKRREKFEFVSWWNQVSKAVKTEGSVAHGLEPVVAFRINKGNWEFLISAKHIGSPHGFLHIDRFVFKKWADKFIKDYRDEMFGGNKINLVIVDEFSQLSPENQKSIENIMELRNEENLKIDAEHKKHLMNSEEYKNNYVGEFNKSSN